MRRRVIEQCTSTGTLSEQDAYEIRILGHIDARWAHWFEGMNIKWDPDGETQLCGPVVDQAALHGLLKKVRDLNMILLSVNRVHVGQRSSARDIKDQKQE